MYRSFFISHFIVQYKHHNKLIHEKTASISEIILTQDNSFTKHKVYAINMNHTFYVKTNDTTRLANPKQMFRGLHRTT